VVWKKERRAKRGFMTWLSVGVPTGLAGHYTNRPSSAGLSGEAGLLVKLVDFGATYFSETNLCHLDRKRDRVKLT
jgi:hypothetical protein